MKTLVPTLVALLLAALAPSTLAEEKNGLLVTVTKRTLNRADRRDGFYYTRYDRTQGLKVTIRNTSFKTQPEGEVNWTLLVKKASYDRTEKYVGTEKLKSLRPSETVELMIGAVPIQGYRYERDYKDELEHDIAVTHAGKETIRLTSMQNFAALAKRAVLMQQEPEGPDEQPGPKRAGTAAPATVQPGAAVRRPPAETTRPPQPVNPGTTPPAPAGADSARRQPAAPPATSPPAAPAETPAPDKADETFDFFNLNRNKAPGAK